MDSSELTDNNQNFFRNYTTGTLVVIFAIAAFTFECMYSPTSRLPSPVTDKH